MSTEPEDKRKVRKPFVPPPPGYDVVLTIDDVAELFEVTVDMVYSYNKNHKLPVHKMGKHCRYLYSEVMTWFMNLDTRIKDDPSLQREYGIDELPKCWPPPGNAEKPKRVDDKDGEPEPV